MEKKTTIVKSGPTNCMYTAFELKDNEYYYAQIKKEKNGDVYCRMFQCSKRHIVKNSIPVFVKIVSKLDVFELSKFVMDFINMGGVDLSNYCFDGRGNTVMGRINDA